MDRDLAKEEIKKSWRQLYPADKKGGIVCPICGSGSGPHGTGITEDKKRPGQLHCFACGFDGDILALIQQERGLDFKAALESAAAELSIPLDDLRQARPRSTAAQDFKEADAAELRSVPESDTGSTGPARSAAAQPDNRAYYERCRAQLTDPAAVSYLKARGISLEAAQYCGIGFDPAADPAGSGHKAPRLIIPVTAAHYIARSIDPATPKAFAKLNNKGAEIGIFDPAGALYNGAGAVFVTEGAIDALSIIEAGGEAIALNSTSNAEKLLKKLEAKPTAATLLLCLDNDEAGRKATRILSEGLQRLNISYQNCCPDICGQYKDPNERLTAQGWKVLNAAVTEATARAARPDNTSFYLDALMQGEIEKFKEGRDRKTGFANLDKEAGGLYPGLYVLAAISSLGKTSFALQIADQIAAAGTDVIFFSLEQSRLELVSKSLARLTYQTNPAHAVTALKIRQGYIFDETLDAIEDYKAAIQDRLSIVEGNFSCNVSFIREYTRQYMQRTGTKPVIFIDYLQILQGEGEKRQSSKELIDSTITELKRISRELDLTVFVISSLNRMNYLTPVSFEALKESGSIEYSADVIYGLQLRCINQDNPFGKEGKLKEKREKIREAKAANPREIELLCLKNRYGISSFSCYFDYFPANDLFRPATDFEDAAQERL
jgi:replicative DNA helicase